jgi:hypothetical protein
MPVFASMFSRNREPEATCDEDSLPAAVLPSFTSKAASIGRHIASWRSRRSAQPRRHPHERRPFHRRTVGIKVGPFGATDLHAMVDQLGTPHSPALHVVERYRLLDHETAKAIEDHNHEDNAAPLMVDNGIARDPNYQGKGLELELTVEDEGVFTILGRQA